MTALQMPKMTFEQLQQLFGEMSDRHAEEFFAATKARVDHREVVALGREHDRQMATLFRVSGWRLSEFVARTEEEFGPGDAENIVHAGEPVRDAGVDGDPLASYEDALARVDAAATNRCPACGEGPHDVGCPTCRDPETGDPDITGMHEYRELEARQRAEQAALHHRALEDRMDPGVAGYLLPLSRRERALLGELHDSDADPSGDPSEWDNPTLGCAIEQAALRRDEADAEHLLARCGLLRRWAAREPYDWVDAFNDRDDVRAACRSANFQMVDAMAEDPRIRAECEAKAEQWNAKIEEAKRELADIGPDAQWARDTLARSHQRLSEDLGL